MKHTTLFLHTLVCTVAFTLLFQTTSEAQATHRPNVVFIVVDDMNTYGVLKQYAPLKMPYMDKLKKQAVLFAHATCASPVCSPSRASFFSGLYPHTSGNYYNGATSWTASAVLQSVEAMPECFKRNGYETFGRGKIFHSPIPKEREEAMFDNRPIYQGGFGPFPAAENQIKGNFWGTQAFEDQEFPDVKNADAAIQFLQQSHEKPFFLYYGLWRPHTPFTAPQRFFDLYDQAKMPFPNGYKEGDTADIPAQGKALIDNLNRFPVSGITTPDAWKRMLWGYCATNSFADWNVGRVIEALDKSLYAKNTIVIVCSDNGYQCGEKNHWEKSTLWELADNVPLLVRTPHTKGAISYNPVSLVDIYPTLVDYCGLTPPAKQKLEGESLLPLLKKPTTQTHRVVLTSFGEHYASLRNNRYRYICYPDGTEELYDHQTDPHEWVNLAGKPELKAIQEQLKKHLPASWTPSLPKSDKKAE